MKRYRPHPALRAAVQLARLDHPELDVAETRWPLVPNYFFYIDDVRVSDSPRDMAALEAIARLVGYSGPLTEPEPKLPTAPRRRIAVGRVPWA